jgi:hypothetical protein
MRAVWFCSLVLGLSLAGWSRADESAEAKAVVDKALKAMGGADKLAKFKIGSFKAKGSGQEGGKEISVVMEGLWQGLSQYRIDAEATHDGRTEKVLFVINGDKGWAKAREKTEDAPEGVAVLIKNALYTLRTPLLLPEWKDDKAFTLTHLGELKINGKTTVGVSAVHKDMKDVSLYFDKDTGLPFKSEVHLTEPQGKEITIEFSYEDYKEQDGVKAPTKVTAKFEGKEFVMEFAELKTKDKIEESEFAKP